MKKTIRYFIVSSVLLIACKGNKSDVERIGAFEPQKKVDVVSTTSTIEEVNTPAISWNGEYCASISIDDLQEKSTAKQNLVIEVAKGYLKEIRNEDKTVIKDFQNVFFDEDGYTEFQTNGKKYQINILASLEDCYDGDVKGFSFQCSGKTKKGKRCRNKTLDASRLCWRHRE